MNFSEFQLIDAIKKSLTTEAQEKALRNGEGGAQGDIFLYGKNSGEVKGLKRAIQVIDDIVKEANKRFIS